MPYYEKNYKNLEETAKEIAPKEEAIIKVSEILQTNNDAYRKYDNILKKGFFIGTVVTAFSFGYCINAGWESSEVEIELRKTEAASYEVKGLLENKSLLEQNGFSRIEDLEDLYMRLDIKIEEIQNNPQYIKQQKRLEDGLTNGVYGSVTGAFIFALSYISSAIASALKRKNSKSQLVNLKVDKSNIQKALPLRDIFL